MRREDVVTNDKRYVWHPYTEMGHYRAHTDPLVIDRAEGVYLYDQEGRRWIDGNSSWWTVGLGHGHPRLVAALEKQLRKMPHVALAGTTHEPFAMLAKELVESTPAFLEHVFYTDNGSTAVEAAVKMALQYWQQNGSPAKTRLLALDGAFHGDTIGMTSLGGVEVFRKPFASVLFDCFHAPVDSHGFERAFAEMEAHIRREHASIAAVVVEPLLQGAAGMRMYSASVLRSLVETCKAHDVFVIFDEVFTGYGRTGKMWATDHLKAGDSANEVISPDFLCIGKTFASYLPMAAVLTTERVFSGFLGDRTRAFFYGHTFAGNPLGAALAREVLRIYRDEQILEGLGPKMSLLHSTAEELRARYGIQTRQLGMVLAADLASSGLGSSMADAQDATGYLGDLGWKFYERAVKEGAYLRPLGNTVYMAPPLVISMEELGELTQIFTRAIGETL